MALTFTIGSAAFAVLATGGSRCAMSADCQSRAYAIGRVHVVGSNGNYVQRGGRNGGKIAVSMRYIGASISACNALYEADKAAWENTAITVTIPQGAFTRCQLDEGSMKKTRVETATGRSAGQVYMDVSASFTIDS